MDNNNQITTMNQSTSVAALPGAQQQQQLKPCENPPSSSTSPTPSGYRRPAVKWTNAEDKKLQRLVIQAQLDRAAAAAAKTTTNNNSPNTNTNDGNYTRAAGGTGLNVKWSKIAKSMENRTSKQCRERYYNVLKSDVTKGNWTKEEDAQIVKLQKEWGNKWTRIAACESLVCCCCGVPVSLMVTCDTCVF